MERRYRLRGGGSGWGLAGNTGRQTAVTDRRLCWLPLLSHKTQTACLTQGRPAAGSELQSFLRSLTDGCCPVVGEEEEEEEEEEEGKKIAWYLFFGIFAVSLQPV